MLLTKSQVYAIVREVINFKKSTDDTTNVTSHVENSEFASIFQYIKERAGKIVIKHSDHQDASIEHHLTRLNYLFNLPNNLEEEYKYCVTRNNGQQPTSRQ
ncbi:lef-11 [Matsumuraeses phaseoli granulovirus]|uniref:Late expression factor 11 n=1 Tax=Matsumuraeses phaseoli granulovirus TaxID=2760664 RepID=A0AAE7SXN7_9BBAC|nr:lef-11 [Matsumuraeses phaseoli granulovirus]QOD40014.1 lef-11 [Matsumuraeses phaseoli granulovirus]